MEGWMVDVAAEELRALEREHPGRFDFLKHEIKAFIAESPVQAFSPRPPDAVDTQVSSTDHGEGKRREGGMEGERQWKRKKKKDSADLALERAAECLRKIRTLKDTLAWW